MGFLNVMNKISFFTSGFSYTSFPSNKILPSSHLETYQHYVDLFRLPQNKPLKDYSKGMKRQAMFALALAIAPKYLLLDEAFDGLDPVMRLAF